MAASAGRVLLIPKGTYNAATTYNMLDVVYYDGATYVCKQTSLGNLPTDTDYWQLMASSSGTAAQVSFDPTGTGLVATNVQNAVVEVKNNISNPNLAHNPWFTVNQRGVTSGSFPNGVYLMDRWKADTAGGTWSLTSSGFSFATTALSNRYLFQYHEGTPFATDTFTLSMKFSDGHIESVTGVPQPDGQTTIVTDEYSGITARLYDSYIMIKCAAGYTGTIKAIKVEKGTISTLALDTAPDYTTELLKCRRYYLRIKAIDGNTGFGLCDCYNTTEASLVLPIPTEMRARPTVSSSGTIRIFSNGSDHTVTSVTFGNQSTTSINLVLTSSGLTADSIGLVRLATAGDYIALDAEL